jgi:hypothetical protein
MWRVSWMIAGLVAQAARREESPDTTLRMELPGESPALQERRATLRPAFAGPWVKGNAPGNARGAVARRATVHGECHREDTASVAYPGDSPEENLRDVFQWIATKVRVKRWGKSPPLRQQWRRQGKPRVVQDQIGGQSRPGSLSTRKSKLPFVLRHFGGRRGRMNPRVGRSIPVARPGLEE